MPRGEFGEMSSLVDNERVPVKPGGGLKRAMSGGGGRRRRKDNYSSLLELRSGDSREGSALLGRGSGGLNGGMNDDDLFDDDDDDFFDDDDDDDVVGGRPRGGGGANSDRGKLGMLTGVLVPCVLDLLGAQLFLRLSWAVGQAGLLGTLGVLGAAAAITYLTILSFYALLSNGHLRGGGAYHIISRTLGIEVGGAVGLLFFLSYALGGAYYALAFATEIQQTFYVGVQPKMWHSSSSWERTPDQVAEGEFALKSIASIVLLSAALLVTLVGARHFTRVNLLLGGALTLAVAVVLGSFLFRTHVFLQHGGGYYTGLTAHRLQNNSFPTYTMDESKCYVTDSWSSSSSTDGSGTARCSFRSVFAILFPAVTGLMEGANLSSELKHPDRALGQGALWANHIGFTVTALLTLLLSAGVPHAVLLSNTLVMQDISFSPYFLVIGALAATASSTLMSLYGAACVLQALARDRLIPGFEPDTSRLDVHALQLAAAALDAEDQVHGGGGGAATDELGAANAGAAGGATASSYQSSQTSLADKFAASSSSSFSTSSDCDEFCRLLRSCDEGRRDRRRRGGRQRRTRNRCACGAVPLLASAAAWAVGQLAVLVTADLDALSPVMTTFMLLCFACINLSCLLLLVSGAPNFRPHFQCFSWQSCLAALLLCIFFTAFIDPTMAAGTGIVLLAIFVLLLRNGPGTAWGDVGQALIFHQVRKYLLRLDERKAHPKLWRPSVLLLINDARTPLVNFCNTLKKGGLYVIGTTVVHDGGGGGGSGSGVSGEGKLGDAARAGAPAASKSKAKGGAGVLSLSSPLSTGAMLSQSCLDLRAYLLEFIEATGVKAFAQVVSAPTCRLGIMNLCLCSGLGALNPNTVVIPFLEPDAQARGFQYTDGDSLLQRARRWQQEKRRDREVRRRRRQRSWEERTNPSAAGNVTRVNVLVHGNGNGASTNGKEDPVVASATGGNATSTAEEAAEHVAPGSDRERRHMNLALRDGNEFVAVLQDVLSLRKNIIVARGFDQYDSHPKAQKAFRIAGTTEAPAKEGTGTGTTSSPSLDLPRGIPAGGLCLDVIIPPVGLNGVGGDGTFSLLLQLMHILKLNKIWGSAMHVRLLQLDAKLPSSASVLEKAEQTETRLALERARVDKEVDAVEVVRSDKIDTDVQRYIWAQPFLRDRQPRTKLKPPRGDAGSGNGNGNGMGARADEDEFGADGSSGGGGGDDAGLAGSAAAPSSSSNMSLGMRMGKAPPTEETILGQFRVLNELMRTHCSESYLLLLPLPRLPVPKGKGSKGSKAKGTSKGADDDAAASSAAFMRCVEVLTDGLRPSVLIGCGEERPVFSYVI